LLPKSEFPIRGEFCFDSLAMMIKLLITPVLTTKWQLKANQLKLSLRYDTQEPALLENPS
jgi:hypothetical protein